MDHKTKAVRMFQLFDGQLTCIVTYEGLDGTTTTYQAGDVLDMYHDDAEGGQVYAVGSDMHFSLSPSQYNAVS